MTTKLSPRDKLSRARHDLFKERPFYGRLLMYLTLEENEKGLTLSVTPDGTVRYNPDYIENMDSKDEVTFNLAHELGHFITHTVGESRMNGRDKMVSVEIPEDQPVDVSAENVYEKNGKKYAVYTMWNIAADFAVNDILEQDDFFVPENTRTPDKYKNKSTEEIYSILDDEIPESEDPPPLDIQGGYAKPDKHESEGESEGSSKGENKGEQLSKEELERRAEERKKKWESRIIKSAEQSDKKGDYPGQLKSIIERLTNPTLDWRSLLNQYITREIIRDVTFSRPHKKSYSLGAYMPSIERESLDVIVAIDTSGSISDELLADFLGEVQGIKDSHTSVDMDIILADAAIQKVHSFKNNQRLNPGDIEMVGRGGTDHRPVFKWVEKNRQGSKILICLTDGYTSFPDKPPMFDTIWAVTPEGTDNDNFPFGQVVRLGNGN